MKNCKICEKLTKRKVYCSRECQYVGYRQFKTFSKLKIEKKCINCEKDFKILESRLKYNGGKYCSRVCKDDHQKIKYLVEGNPMFGKKMSVEAKIKRSYEMIELWKNEEFINKINIGKKEFIEKNGYYPGSDKITVEKKKNNNINKYGYEHNWEGEYGKRQCDITFIEKYGITSIEYMNNALRNMSKSRPESVFEMHLKDLKIDYEFQYYLLDRYFDFAIIDLKIVIEIDGDYFHGKGKEYENMDKLQKRSYNNDRYKDVIANDKNWKLIRIWESDLYNMNIDQIKKLIWEK